MIYVAVHLTLKKVSKTVFRYGSEKSFSVQDLKVSDDIERINRKVNKQ